MRKALLALSLVLGACATQNNVAATEVALTGAMQGALIYMHLPRCPQPSGVCSQQTVVDQIKLASTAAYNAVKAAELDPTNTGLSQAAAAAVQTLVTITPQTGAK